RETVAITKEITLIGEEGAVLDPSQPLNLDWTPAPGVGQGVYRAAAERRPRVLCLGGKIVAEIDERRRETRAERSPWQSKALLVKGPRLGAFQYIRAVWIYRDDEQALYVHLADDADPAAGDWSSTPSADPVITIKGATGASVSGLTVAHGQSGVV